jgi:hypothetical protein
VLAGGGAERGGQLGERLRHVGAVLLGSRAESFALRKVDISDRPDLAERFRVQSASLLVVDDNQIRGRLHQPRTVVQIRELLDPWLR